MNEHTSRRARRKENGAVSFKKIKYPLMACAFSAFVLVMAAYAFRDYLPDVRAVFVNATATPIVLIRHTKAPSPVPTPSPTPRATRHITLAAAGDCTWGDASNAGSFTAVYDRNGADPAWPLKNVRDIFASCDVAIINFEGTLTDARVKNTAAKFAFRGKPIYREIPAKGGVTIANIANNHSEDYLAAGYRDTIANLERVGIGVVGVDAPHIEDKNGVKIGFCSFRGSMAASKIRGDIAALKEQGCELIIATFHWGIENAYTPTQTQINLGRAAIDAGAHVVLGHHSHVINGMELYNGGVIAYSLGNFSFGGHTNPSDKDTFIFRQTFAIDGEGQVTSPGVSIIPCSISSAKNTNNYQPTPYTAAVDINRVMGKIKRFAPAGSTFPDVIN